MKITLKSFRIFSIFFIATTVLFSLAFFSLNSFNNSTVVEAANSSCPNGFSQKSGTQSGVSQIPGQDLQINNSKICVANDVSGRTQNCSAFGIFYGWNGDSGRCNVLINIGQNNCQFPFSSKDQFISGSSKDQYNNSYSNSSVCFYIGSANCTSYSGAWRGDVGNCSILKSGSDLRVSSSSSSSYSRYSSVSSSRYSSSSSSRNSSTSYPQPPVPNNQTIYILVEKWGAVNGQVTKVYSSGNWLSGVYNCNQPVSSIGGVSVSDLFSQCNKALNMANGSYLFAYKGVTDESFGANQQKFNGFTYSQNNTGNFVNWFNFNQGSNVSSAAVWESI